VLPGKRKTAGQPKNKLVCFLGLPGGFSLCALRTAGPASLACPEAGKALLLQVALAAFTTINGVFCFSFDAKEKRFLPRPISACVCCFYGEKRGFLCFSL